MTSEFGITFSAAGGHNHDGISSSRVDTTSYSIFDFRTGVIGNNPSRISLQETNKISFDNYIINLLNTREFSPSLIKIKPSSLTGKIIVQGTLTADKLETNFVLVNQQIKSNNYNGIINSNNEITTPGTQGWAITSTGDAEFNDVNIRGTVALSSSDYLIAGSGAGVRLKTSSGGETGVVLFGDSIFSPNIYVDGPTGGSISMTHDGDEYMVIDCPSDVGGVQPLIINRLYSSGANFIQFRNNNTPVGAVEFANSSGINYKVTSDKRLKENIKEISNPSMIIKLLEPVEYNFISDGPEIRTHGFLAQDMYDVYKIPVSVGSDDVMKNPWGIDYSKLTPLLTAALKETINKIESLEARLQALEGV